MKYVVLDNDNMVKDVLITNPIALYDNARYVMVNDDVVASVGMYYDFKTDTFYTKTAETTQADRIEANLDYLVLLNS